MGEGVLIEMPRQFGNGGGDRIPRFRGAIVAIARIGRRLARRGRGDTVIHWIWVVEGVLPRGGCERKVLKHSERGST